VAVDSVQIEVDAGYEGARDIVLVEAKIGRPRHLNVRQLYYPWRHFRSLVPGKTVRPLLLTYDIPTTRYELHEYTFATTDDPGTWLVLRSAGYRLFGPEQRRLDDLLEPRRRSQPGVVPQADDFNRLVQFIEVLEAGVDRTGAIAEQVGFDKRQAQYYREAAEYLGLVHPTTYWPSDAGRDLLRAGPQRRRELLARAVVNAWVLRELLDRGERITRSTIEAVIADTPGPGGRPRYSGTTVARRAKTIWAWLRWLADEVGCFRSDDGGFVAG
jgi:hypothetical protein